MTRDRALNGISNGLTKRSELAITCHNAFRKRKKNENENYFTVKDANVEAQSIL